MPELIKPGAQYVARLSRFLGPLAVACLCLWLLSAHLQGLGLSSITRSISEVAPLNWALAFAATAISFWSLGRYDAVAHRHLQTHVPGPQARRAGMAAIAFSQTIGFGLISSSFARWRLTPGLSPLLAFQVTLFVTLSFFVALGAIISLGFVVRPPFPGSGMIGALGLLAYCALLALAFLYPKFQLAQRSISLPPVPAILAISFWALMDTMAAGSVLYLLMPPDLGLGWEAVVSVYLLALGAALISGAPGGVGPFELTVLALLPMAQSSSAEFSGTPPFVNDVTGATAGIVAGIIAFRLVYFAFPALVSGLWLLWPPRLMQLAPPHNLANIDPLSFSGARAETGVLRQNTGGVLGHDQARVAVIETPQTLTSLFDPLSGEMSEAVAQLSTAARDRNRVACVYKCDARSAIVCRQAGWSVLRIAQDAILKPAEFEIAGAARRQLRRKLRQAEKNHVVITPANAGLPLDEMAEIDLEWQSRNGRARGLTMGRFQASYLQQQRVYLAWQQDSLCAFVSLHVAAGEWALDLMRSDDNAPDGTMHSLIVAALEDARRLGVNRLSLAAIPDHRFAHRASQGLSRFKTSFAPRWEPRFMAAPTRAALAIALADLIRMVQSPPPLPAEGWNDFHKEDENIEFAMSMRS